MSIKNSFRVILFVLLSCLLPLSGYAYSTPWKFEIDPYVWAINMNGRVGVGPATAHVDQSFSDILKQLNFAAMVYASAHKDKFGVYTNIIYAATSADANIDNISIDAKNKMAIIGAGVSYLMYDTKLDWWRHYTIEPFVGFRYTLNNTTVNISHFTFKKDVNWTDPVVGLNIKYDFTREWFGQLSGDIGGTNRASDFTYSAMGLLGYHPRSWTNTSIYAGYRLLSQHYETGSGNSFYNWDMKLFGPLLGFRFTF